MFLSQLRSIAWVLGVALAYYAAARLGLLLQLPGTNASPVWPPSGIGLAALLIFGRRVWPGILLGAFFANLLTLPNDSRGFLASSLIAGGNTLEQIVALLLVRRLVPSANPFDHPQDVLRFLVAACLACAVASTNGATSLWLLRLIEDDLYRSVWYTWWLGDLSGMLVLSPALYCWWRVPRPGLPAARTLELALLVALAGLTAELLFGGWIASPIGSLLFLFVVPGLAWAAFRFGPRETSSLAVVISVIAIGHTWVSMSNLAGTPSAGRSAYLPFLSPVSSANESLLMLQTFICVMVVTAIMLAAAVNERTMAERSLADSERRFRTIFEQAAIGAALVETPTGRFVRINQHYCDLVGYSTEEMSRMSFHAITHPDDLQEDENGVRRLVTGAIGEFTLEKRYCRKDGTIVWVNLTVSPTWRPGEKPEYHIAIVEDITERKRAEDDLRRNRERLDLAQRAGRIGAFDWAIPTGEVAWTAELEALYGLPSGGFGGKYENWIQAVHLDDRDRVEAEVQSAVAGSTDLDSAFRVVWPDGTVRWLYAKARAFASEAGQPPRLVGVNMDMTEQKLAKEEVRRLNEELEQRVRERTAELEASNKELEAFSYSVSHDLRAPLRAIDGFSGILMQHHGQELTPQAQEYLQLVRDNTQQMGQLIDDLLTFARLSRQPIKKQVVEPAVAVQQCLDDLHGERQGRQIEVSVGNLPPCWAEPSLLKQVWMNLLANALKYTRKRELAKIEVGHLGSDRNGELIYHIKDNGVGFDMRYAHKLFGVFQRLHRAEEYEGTGVGLAIVQRIVHRHGGRVWAEAQPNQGATFFFTLDRIS